MDPEMVLSVVDITDEIQVHISEAIHGRKCEPWSTLIDTIIITVRNNSCGKAMFSQVSDILSTGGVCMAGGGEACMVGGMCGGGCAWQGACMVGGGMCGQGGMCGGGGHAWQGGCAWWGACMAGGLTCHNKLPILLPRVSC